MTHSCPLCHHPIQALEVSFDWDSGIIAAGQESVLLSHQEADVFKTLWDKRGIFIRHEAMASAIFGSVSATETQYDVIKVYICKIRKKIKLLPIQIETRNSVGYRVSLAKE